MTGRISLLNGHEQSRMLNALIKKLEASLPAAMAADRAPIARELIRINRYQTGAGSDGKLNKRLLDVEKRLQKSMRRKDRRKEIRPRLTYNPELPIVAYKAEIIDTISKNQVVVISGETGSGKTTQIPKFCLAAGRGIDGIIGCTQPRRISTTTVAHRIAEELGESIGRSVGYKMRFKEQTSPHGFIKVMTDGILLAETLSDPYLYDYDTIIVDEAHERSLNIDFILGLIKELTPKRNDLKVIITSATIDTEKFSAAFDKAPVIEVSGRMYPVEVRYSATETELEKTGEQTHVERAAQAVDEIQRESSSGSILVFMPTEQDIREACDIMRGKPYRNVVILPLYARLPSRDQQKVFRKTKERKIIVATNVAETSITIPGIKYVVDTGLARISQYSPRLRVTSLPVLPISKSSADQRKGRCGRVANGICIRLFSETEYETSPPFTVPEILRANLAEVILRMIALKLGEVYDFPFIDKPAAKNIKDGIDLLFELGAITSKEEAGGGKRRKRGGRFVLTAIGKMMAKVPLDPRLSRILIEAHKEGCLREMAVIASALSIQDPRERPAEKTQEADRVHATFDQPASDFITLLNIWGKYRQIWKTDKSTSQNIKQVKKFCQANYLSYRRIREWQDIHGQIIGMLGEFRMLKPKNSRLEIPDSALSQWDASSGIHDPQYEKIHKSILSGFLSNIALKKEKHYFQGANGKETMIFPGSGLFDRTGAWIVAAEMVETSRLFARTVANIDSRWLEELGRSQCKYSYRNPRWDRSHQNVVADEQVSLYGLIIIPQRKVSYVRINPREASQIFIRDAITGEGLKTPLPFMRHNRKLLEEIRDKENRLRRRDLLVSEEEIFRLYRKPLEGVYDLKTLRQRIKESGGDGFLKMSRKDLMLYDPDESELALCPDAISLGNHEFQCAYRFSPEQEDDGVTLKIPSDLVPIVSPDAIDWLVPALLKEKITALIKGLPKAYRKKLVPIAECVEKIMAEIPQGEGPLITKLGKFIYTQFGIDIPGPAWSEDGLPDYLKMRLCIQDAQGKEIQTSRDKGVLKQAVSSTINADEFESAQKAWQKDGIRRWDFGDLPDCVTVRGKSGTQWILYPALKDDLDDKRQVRLGLFKEREEALRAHQKGVAKLFTIHFSSELRFLKRKIGLPKGSQKLAVYFGGQKHFEKSLYESIVHGLFYRNIRKADEFKAHAGAVLKLGILDLGEKRLNRVVDVLEAYQATRKIFSNLETTNRANVRAIDFLKRLRNELATLVPQTFIALYDDAQLGRMVRYIKAIGIRAQRGILNLEKDQERTSELMIYSESLNDLVKSISPLTTAEKRGAIEDFFWMLEEYKVSIFAQELKTSIPVSRKRLDEKLKEIQRMV